METDRSKHRFCRAIHTLIGCLPARVGNMLPIACLAVLVLSGGQAGYAEGLIEIDSEVQVLKEELVEINHELSLLEQELLYPSTKQLVFFVSVDREIGVSLSSIRIELDGEVVVEHEYTRKESDAVRRGGVHRPYLGTLGNGKHWLVAYVTARIGEGETFQLGGSKVFVKDRGPSYIEFRVNEVELDGLPLFTIHKWNP